MCYLVRLEPKVPFCFFISFGYFVFLYLNKGNVSIGGILRMMTDLPLTDPRHWRISKCSSSMLKCECLECLFATFHSPNQSVAEA